MRKTKTHVFVHSEGEPSEVDKDLKTIGDALEKAGYKQDNEEHRASDDLGLKTSRRGYVKKE